MEPALSQPIAASGPATTSHPNQPSQLSQPGQQAGGRIAAAVGGIGFAVLLFVSVAAVDVPRAAGAGELTAWWSDPANQRAEVVSTFAFLAAGLCFMVFLSHLHARLRAIAPHSTAGTLVGFTGMTVVLMMFLTGSMGALARGPLVDGEPVAGADLLRYLPQIRYVAMGAYALPAAALLIAVTSYVVLRFGGLPRWTGWLGIVCWLPIVATIVVYRGQLSIPALLLWVVALSLALLRPPRTS